MHYITIQIIQDSIENTLTKTTNAIQFEIINMIKH